MSSKFLDKTGLNTLWAKIKSTFQTLGNLVTAWGSTPSDANYPSEKLVKTSLDAKATDGDVVHKAGEETITGNKVFKNGVEFFSTSGSSGYGIFVLPNTYAGTAYNNWPEEYRDGAHFREWTLHFPAGVNFWGRVRISFLGGYSSYNASGSISKTILCAFNGSTVFNNTGSYDALGINTETEFRISDLIWDNTNGYWTVKIHSIKPTSNNIVIAPRIEFACGNNFVSTARQITWSSNSPSIVTDTTYYTKRSGNAATAPTSSGVLFNWADKPVFQSPYGYEIFDRSHTVPIENGGTGKTTAPAAEYTLLSNARTEITTYDDNSRFLCEGTAPSEQVGVVSGFRKASTIWNYIVGKISSDLGLTATNYGGTADTATNVSGNQVGQDNRERHLWFSTSIESKRGYIDSLTYRSDINRITADISGCATGLSRSHIIEHQGNKDTYPLHRIASYPDSLVTTQSPYGDNSLILHLFTKGNLSADYGIVMITVKMQAQVDIDHAPSIKISWKLRSSGISTDAVQAVCIYSGGLWHVDVFFRIQKQYQLMVFNKLGSYSVNGVGTNGGWTLHSSTDASGSADEVYTDYSGTTNTAASWKLYKSPSYNSAGDKLGDGGIVGTADVASKLGASGGSSIQPVYFPSSGNNAGKPVPIPFDSALTSYLTMQVTNSNYANSAGTANKWTSPRIITIMDDSLTNAGTPTTGVDGSGNIVLRLPTTIIANLGGTAEQANKDSNGNWIHQTYATKAEVTTNHYTKYQSDSIFAAASEGALGFSSPGNPQNYATGTSSSLSGDYIVQFSKGTTYANSINVLPTFAEGTTGYRVNVPLYKDTTERDTSTTLVPNSTTVGYGTLLNYAYQRMSGKIGTLVGAVCFRPVVYKYVYGSIQQDTLLTDSEDWYLMSKSGTKVKGSVKPSDYSTLSIKLPTGINSATGVGIVNVIENSSVTARVWCRIENGLLTFITDASNFGVFTRGKFYGFNVILNF